MKLLASALLFLIISPGLSNRVQDRDLSVWALFYSPTVQVNISVDTVNGQKVLHVSQEDVRVDSGDIIDWHQEGVVGCNIVFEGEMPDVQSAKPTNPGDYALQFDGVKGRTYKYDVVCPTYQTLDPHVIVHP